MKYEVEQITMSDGNVNFFHSWIPDDENEIKACIVFSHGMDEHMGRYNKVATKFAESGLAFYAEDHRGHGKTAEYAENHNCGQFRHLADKNGFFRVAEDIHEEIQLVKNKHPGKRIILIGHSFGSLISQYVIENYGSEINKCVLCGTAGPRPVFIWFGMKFSSFIRFCIGARKFSPFVQELTFGAYNDKIDEKRTEFDWLCTVDEEVDKYITDPWCGGNNSVAFLNDITIGLNNIHKKKNMKKIPKSLSVLLIAGMEDPVGSYGKTVQMLGDVYMENGMTDVNVVLYPDDRHELFWEKDAAQIFTDVKIWCLN